METTHKKLLFQRGEKFFLSDKQTTTGDGWMTLHYVGLDGTKLEKGTYDTHAQIGSYTLIEISGSQYDVLLKGFQQIRNLIDLQCLTIRTMFVNRQ